jgi:hypothetical protein
MTAVRTSLLRRIVCNSGFSGQFRHVFIFHFTLSDHPCHSPHPAPPEVEWNRFTETFLPAKILDSELNESRPMDPEALSNQDLAHPPQAVLSGH